MKRLTLALQDEFLAKVFESPKIFLFLDYDGTLSPIADKPSLAKLSPSIHAHLVKLSKNPKFKVAIVSGRGLKEVKALIRIKDLIYAGNHGLEVEGPDFHFLHPKVQSFMSSLAKAQSALKPLSKKYKGSFLENKGFTLTYHYRLLNPNLVSSLEKELRKCLLDLPSAKDFRLTQAKMAFEIRPNLNWNKGSAVLWILLREDPGAFPIYIGDDFTDESAFRALKGRGLCLRVGRSPKSDASHYLEDVPAVESFLKKCLDQPKVLA